MKRASGWTRITRKHLEPVIARLNRLTNSPADPWTRGEDGFLHASIGNFHLSSAYGGWSLHRVENECGGVSDVFSCGHVPARELYNQLHAYLRGIEGANLSGANLSEADLSEVDLFGVNLSGANLSEADLSEVDLFGVNLSGQL